jgi:sirohydrochlorin ferrochelatase
MKKAFSIRFAALAASVIALIASDLLAVDVATVPALPTEHPAPLIVAPDRGFQGNEEIRDALEAFTDGTHGEIVFVTDERTRDTLKRATQRLAEAGAREIVVLPLFLSASDPRWVLAQRYLAEWTNTATAGAPRVIAQSRVFGQSYFAVEILADRFRSIANPAGREVIVIGCADETDSSQRLEADWQRLATLAAEGFGFKSVRALVWPAKSRGEARDESRKVERTLADLVINGERVAVVPFHLGKKLDGMMTLNANLRSKLPKAAEWIESDVTPHPAVAQWIAREVNRQTPFRAEDLGVVFLAHGSDYHWNETMREAIASLTERYKIEFAFSMADPPLIERAVHRLEQRGARAIVVVRVFGLADSFEQNVKRALGLDVEEAFTSRGPLDEALCSPDPRLQTNRTPARVVSTRSHDDHHGHADGPQPRIRSSALLATVGGLEAHPFFASALLDRAKALSKDAARETIVLVAHGSGDDATNERWRRLLESLATQMRTNGGASFRAIRAGTWREDWPDKRAPEVAAIRRMVEEASRDAGRALVIPARTSAEGNEREWLKGLEFELGTGFAPHPLFARWAEEQIRKGTDILGLGRLSSDTRLEASRGN